MEVYADNEEMLSELNRLNPDVLILGGNGSILDRCRICHEVRTRCPTTKVLTLTEKQKDDELYEIILSGASGNVHTNAGSAEMIRSVGVVACGGLNFDSDALIRLLGRITTQRQSGGPHELARLTGRETEVLSLIALGHRNTVIGQMLNVSNSTVKSDLVHIREKLLIDSRTELAAYAVRHGVGE